jgi:hypothetical protein
MLFVIWHRWVDGSSVSVIVERRVGCNLEARGAILHRGCADQDEQLRLAVRSSPPLTSAFARSD